MAFFLVADSIRTDLVITFHNLTLKQAAEIERRINNEFGEYDFSVTLPTVEKATPKFWWNYNENLSPIPYQMLDTVNVFSDSEFLK